MEKKERPKSKLGLQECVKTFYLIKWDHISKSLKYWLKI